MEKAKQSLVTGGAGFLGHHLVKRLVRQGRYVRVLDLKAPADPVPGVEYVSGSILDRAALRRCLQGIQHVYHTAGKPDLWSLASEDFFLVNHRGTQRVCEEALRAGVKRLVYTSTEAILRDFRRRSDRQQPADVTGAVSLDDLPGSYCQSKFLAEQEVLAAVKQGLPAVIVNLAVPIGPGDWNLTPPSRMLLGFLNGAYPAYLESTLNLIDVRDVAAGHILAAERGCIGKRYVLGHTVLSLSKLLALLEALTGLPMPRWRVPYSLALGTSMLGECIARHITHRRPAAPLAGVRLARAPARFDGTEGRRKLGLSGRPLRESLADAIRWFGERNLLERQPLKSL